MHATAFRAVRFLAAAALALGIAASTSAEPPAAIPDSSQNRAGSSFDRFAQEWLQKMEKSSQRTRQQPKLMPAGAAVRSPSKEFRTELKATGRPGAPYVGILRYEEYQLRCDAGGENCRVVGKTPVTEIFRFKNGRWIY